jgi:hypothetical protein
MRRIGCFLAVTVLAAGGALAQGQFTFGNKNLTTTPVIDAKVLHPLTCQPLAGADFYTQAYVKLVTDPDSSYAPIGSAVNFRTGNNAGYIVPVVLTTSFAGGTAINVEMRVWDASGGNSYEAAIAAGKLAGKSMPVTLTVTVAPAPPADMMGLQSIGCIPEPSSLTLVILGVASLLFRPEILRRKP